MDEYQTPIVLSLLGFLVLLLVLERLVPLRVRRRPAGPRILSNAVLTALSFGVAAVTVGPVSMYLAEWTRREGFGLARVAGFPPVLQAVVAFLLMDYSFYWWHRLMHTVAPFWRLHKVHHVDPDMDVTTSFRFHAAETAVSTGFRVVQVGFIGVPPSVLFVYGAVFQAATLFHHSNLRLPLRTERLLNAVIVTPRMHGVHHSQVVRETNSNYAVIFRVWDWLHRSLRITVPQAGIDIGVAGYERPEDNSIPVLLAMPFTKPREMKRDERSGEGAVARGQVLAE